MPDIQRQKWQSNYIFTEATYTGNTTRGSIYIEIRIIRKRNGIAAI